MKKTNTIKRRIVSMVLALAMVLMYVPALVMPISAEGVKTKISDSSTMDTWMDFFGKNYLSTEYAGSIWTDKSVFTDGEAFAHLTDEKGNPLVDIESAYNFLVALSAISSNKEIVGYAHIPTDTVLVLDVSGSMGPGQNNNDAVDELVSSANEAIKALQDANKYSRVSVVLYSGNNSTNQNAGVNTTTVLLPMGRYTHADNEFLEKGSTTTNNGGGNGGPGGNNNNNNSNAYETVKVNTGVTDENGTAVSISSKTVRGGTYIQNGIYQAMQQLLAVEDTSIEGDNFQSGTTRIPIMVLMSDGAPTIGTSNYAGTSNNNIGSSNIGSGSGTSDVLGFVTQLTASYAKARVEEHYGRDAYFYTLGYGVGGDSIAESVLDPENSTSTIDSYWRSYLSLRPNRSLQISSDGHSASISSNSYVTEQSYVDRYFEASTQAELVEAFDYIVDQIILQSLYYPTLIEGAASHNGGYIEFIDDIGDHMEVKEIEGIVIGDVLYTGALLARNFTDDGGSLGTVDNPNALGDEMVYAAMERFGIDKLFDTREEAIEETRSLITLAYEHGQLSYTSDTEFSNYIGWYSDANDEYQGFWSDLHGSEEIPENAVYYSRSYGMLGAVKPGNSESDLMHISIRVRTNIETGDTTLFWKIPAALVPVVTYSVSLTGDSYDNMGDISMTVSDNKPMTLLFEVGLSSDITPLNIVEKLGDTNRNDDGTYTFYTNKWSEDAFKNNPEPTKAINTVSFYEPSVENERYYYNESTPVYQLINGEYVLYTGAEHPEGDNFYRQFRVFSIVDEATGEAKCEYKYEIMSAHSLEVAEYNEEENAWYIPQGTIHLMYLDFFTKSDNATNTLDYASFLTIESHMDSDLTDGDDSYYYADIIMGNNGLLTVEPATGLKISKTVDSTVSDENAEFLFTVEGSVGSTTVLATHYDANGNASTRAVRFTDGVSESIMLKANETIYVTDIPEGEYTVTELESTDYAVKSINSVETNGVNYTEVTVSKYELTGVVFENTLRTFGNVIVSKRVEHPLGSTYVIPSDIKFEFVIRITDENGAPVSDESYTTTYSETPAVTDADGILTVNGSNILLGANHSVTVFGIEEGYQVSAQEINLPEGFTQSSVTNQGRAEVSTEENRVIEFVNTYDPEKADVNITIEGTKTLTGREWKDTDSFEFRLQEYNRTATVWEQVGQPQYATAANKSFDFTSAIQSEEYTAAGTYHYRVVEVYNAENAIGGITYDAAIGYFNVTVTDSDMDGKYEISSVTSLSPASVAYSASERTWNVSVGFTNVYAASGGASAEISIIKTVENRVSGEDISPAGFVFGIYDGHNQIGTVTTDANGNAVFSMAFTSLDIGRTFNYTVREIPGTETGMHYTEVEYHVEVSIVDDLNGGITAYVYEANTDDSIPADADNAVELSFVNIYNPDDASVTVEGKKILSGRGMEEGEFSFELYTTGSDFAYSENASPVIAHNNADGSFSFGTLMYSEVGTYYYAVVETNTKAGGVTYDETVFEVTVTVTDENGVLKASVSYSDGEQTVDGIEFVNTYTVSPTTAVIEGSKILVGRELKAGEFDFVLYDAQGNEIESVSNNADGSFSFTELTFDKADTYVYTIEEDAGKNLGGVTYDTSVITVTVTVTDNLDGTLSAVVSYSETPVFTNVYEAEGTTATVSGNKVLTGRDLIAGEFDFVLYDAQGNKIESVSNKADGSFSFTALTFDTADTYVYTIREDGSKALGGVTYDERVITVTITVTDNLDGTMSASVKYSETPIFTNTYETESTTATVSGNKVLTGRDLKAGEFDFVLYDAEGNKVESVTNKADGSFSFTELTFDKADTYIYTIKEDASKALGGITYDTSVITVTVTVTDNLDGTLSAEVEYSKTPTFTNTYGTESTTAVIAGNKVLTGRDLSAGEFTFVLYDAAGGEVDRVSNNADGSFTFKTLSFDTADTYVYTIVEDSSKALGGVTYDTSVITVTVTVTDNLDGTLSVNVEYSKTPTFENSYASEDASAVIEGNKTLTGRDLAEGEFTFVLYDAEGNKIESVTNKADGSFSFTELTFDKADTYVYTVKEDSTSPAERVTYDEREYLVAITVRDNGKGELEVTSVTISVGDEKAEGIEFANVYTPRPQDITVDITVNKVVENTGSEKIGPEGFAFLVENITAGGSSTVVMDASGRQTVSLTFTEEDIGKTFEYRITEINTGVENVLYSEAVYLISITVSLEDDNTLSAEVSVNGERADTAVAEFVNTYHFVPQTGDNTDNLIMAAICCIGTAALIAVAVFSKKKRRYFAQA